MAAVKAGFSVVGDLVAAETIFFQVLRARVLHVRDEIRVGRRDLPRFHAPKQRRALLEYQRVGRDVLDAEIDDASERVEVLPDRLARQAVHHVGIDVTKARLARIRQCV